MRTRLINIDAFVNKHLPGTLLRYKKSENPINIKGLKYLKEDVFLKKPSTEVFSQQEYKTIRKMLNFNANKRSKYLYSNGYEKFVEYLTPDFSAKQDRLRKNAGKYAKYEVFDEMISSETPKELAAAISRTDNGMELKLVEAFRNVFDSVQNEKDIKRAVRKANAIKGVRTKILLTMYKSLAEVTTNPRILEIENILKKEYGFKSLCLNNDLQRAEELFAAAKILKKNGLSMPNEAVVSDYLFCRGENFESFDGSICAVVQSSRARKQFKNFFSDVFVNENQTPQNRELLKKWLAHYNQNGAQAFTTDSPLHLWAHEILHKEHIYGYCSMIQIPEVLDPIINKLPLYCFQTRSPQEILTELNTKRYLGFTLSKDEDKLRTYLNGKSKDMEFYINSTLV